MHVLYKPVSQHCQLKCEYCFYRDNDAQKPRMDVAKRALELMAAWPSVPFALQGGEPLLSGYDFVREAVEYGSSLAGERLACTIQTNGILLDSAWAKLLKKYGFLVGISIDGPKALHDARRVPASYDRVRAGLEYLKQYGVKWNVLCVVNKANVEHPLDVYRHLRDDVGATYVQFIPENNEITPEQWGAFLVPIWEEWWPADANRIGVLNFTGSLQILQGHGPAQCTQAKTCGKALLLEADGSVYSCDRIVNKDHLLGSIFEHTFEELAFSKKQMSFGFYKAKLPKECKECSVLALCHGNCPLWRDASGKHKLCGGYKAIYTRIVSDLSSHA